MQHEHGVRRGLPGFGGGLLPVLGRGGTEMATLAKEGFFGALGAFGAGAGGGGSGHMLASLAATTVVRVTSCT